jgi:Protein of unknown function (DUF3293)
VRSEPDDQDSWASYERTVVEIDRLSGGSLRVRSASEPDVAGWPWPTTDPVHVLTAWDPGIERPGPELNRRRQAALEADLSALAVPLLAASGVDPATGRREEGVAVLGAAESAILALGARYGQDAVFAWTPAEWAIVACQGTRRLVSGWALVGPQPGFPYRTPQDAPI